jgi:hypothetical protein
MEDALLWHLYETCQISECQWIEGIAWLSSELYRQERNHPNGFSRDNLRDLQNEFLHVLEVAVGAPGSACMWLESMYELRWKYLVDDPNAVAVRQKPVRNVLRKPYGSAVRKPLLGRAKLTHDDECSKCPGKFHLVMTEEGYVCSDCGWVLTSNNFYKPHEEFEYIAKYVPMTPKTNRSQLHFEMLMREMLFPSMVSCYVVDELEQRNLLPKTFAQVKSFIRGLGFVQKLHVIPMVLHQLHEIPYPKDYDVIQAQWLLWYELYRKEFIFSHSKQLKKRCNLPNGKFLMRLFAILSNRLDYLPLIPPLKTKSCYKEYGLYFIDFCKQFHIHDKKEQRSHWALLTGARRSSQEWTFQSSLSLSSNLI